MKTEVLLSGVFALLLTAACSPEPEMTVEAGPEASLHPQESTGMIVVDAMGAEACANQEIIDVVDDVIAQNVNFAGAPYDSGPIRYGVGLTADDEKEFKQTTVKHVDQRVTTLFSVDQTTRKTTCSSQYVVEVADKEWRVPLTFSAQPNAAGDDYVVEVIGLAGLQEAVNFARARFLNQVIYPRRTAALSLKSNVVVEDSPPVDIENVASAVEN